MTALHLSLRELEMPARMRRLPLDERGFPVPFFVAVVDGKPDHRVIDPAKLLRCIVKKLCWLCGDVLGQHCAFIIGPMTAITRVHSEPPSHRDCALFAVKACPFLSRPHAKRRLVSSPDCVEIPAAYTTPNPGVACVWVTRSFRLAKKGGAVLFELTGEPTAFSWWTEGRLAARADVERAVREGLPTLLKHTDVVTARDIARDAVSAERYWPVAS